MLKRIFPVISVISLVCCLLAVPVSADTIYKVLNYKNYVYGTSDNGSIEYFKIPSSDSAVQTVDRNGITSLPSGQFSGTLYGNFAKDPHVAVVAYWPGQGINNTYLLASNIADGTSITFDCGFTLSDDTQQVFMELVYRFAVLYFDEGFNPIGYQSNPLKSVEITSSGYSDYTYEGLIYQSITLDKPTNAAYLCFYATFDMYASQVHEDDFYIDWWIGEPYFESDYNEPLPSVPGEVTLNDDMVLWLKDVVDSFLEFEIAPGFSMNKIIYVILVVGVLLWLIKLIS